MRTQLRGADVACANMQRFPETVDIDKKCLKENCGCNCVCIYIIIYTHVYLINLHTYNIYNIYIYYIYNI